MKILISAFLILMLFSTPCFSKNSLTEVAVIDSPFDMFESNVSWAEQKSHLLGFAVALKHFPEMIGVIIYESGDKYPLKTAKARINRSVKYLTQEMPKDLRVERKRLVVVYAGKDDYVTTTLQPIDQDKLPPEYRKLIGN